MISRCQTFTSGLKKEKATTQEVMAVQIILKASKSLSVTQIYLSTQEFP